MTEGKPHDRKDAGKSRRLPIYGHARLVFLLTMSFVGAFVLLVGLKITKDYQDTLVGAETQAAAMIGALSADFRSQLERIDAQIQFAAEAHRNDIGGIEKITDDRQAKIRSQIDTGPLLRDFQLLDRNGEIIFSTRASADNLPNQSTSESFLFHQTSPEEVYLVQSGQTLELSRRLATDRGGFAGVAMVKFKNDYLTTLARAGQIGRTQNLILAGRDGRILADSNADSQRPNNITVRLGLPSNQADMPDSQIVFGVNAQGMRSLIGVAQIEGTPFTLYLTQSVRDALAVWYSSLSFYALVILAPTLFGAAVCGTLVRQTLQRNNAIAARQNTEARLKIAINGAMCGIWDWDVESNRVHWSTSMFRLLGQDPTSQILFTEDLRDLMHVDDRDKLSRIVKITTIEKAPYDEVIRLRHRDGHWIWFHLKGQLLQGPDWDETTKTPARIVGIALDITEQKDAESRVAKMEEQLRNAVENISEAFVVWDKNNKLVMCNKSFGEFYGIPEDLLISGTTAKSIINASAKSHTLLQDDRGSRSDKVELQYVLDRWLHVSTRQTRDGGRVSVATDVTPLKEQEDELLKSERQLKLYVQQLEESQHRLKSESSERAELAVKYAKEKARAEEANRSKTEFLANMSHELRTPLNAIMGFAQIMNDGMFGPLGDEKYEAYTKDILDSATYLLALINDILDMSKIETGKMELDAEPVALGHIVQSCLRLIEPRVFDAGLRLNYDPPPLPSVHVDPRATKQILLNLLSNAVKFTPHGGEITIETEVSDESAALTVIDTGIGISQQDLRRIGMPFEQIENQHTKTHKGSGLGLALAKSLAELQGGTLTIKSELGVGSSFRFSMPRRKPRQETAPPASDMIQAAQPGA